jgi:hypothetical protein
MDVEGSLFAGYCFVRLGDRLAVLQSHGVIRFVDVLHNLSRVLMKKLILREGW